MNHGERNDLPPRCDKPWLLPQTTLHAQARRTFCTSVCKLKLTPSNYIPHSTCSIYYNMGQQGWVDRELGYIVGRAGGSCLPEASPKLPRAFKSLSKSRQRLPKASQSLPKSPQSLPKASQSLPKAFQSLPKASPKPPKASPKSPQRLPRLTDYSPEPPRGPQSARGKERKSNPIKDSGSGRETPIETGAMFLFGETAFLITAR